MFETIYYKVEKWAADRGISINGNALTQTAKLASELGELNHNTFNGSDVRDDIGDCIVVLVSLSQLNNMNLLSILNDYYEDIPIRISNSKSQMVLQLNATFGDLADAQIKENWKDWKQQVLKFMKILDYIAQMNDTSLNECFAIAYDDIKDRKGFLTAAGNFIKETDPNYDRLLKEAQNEN